MSFVKVAAVRNVCSGHRIGVSGTEARYVPLRAQSSGAALLSLSYGCTRAFPPPDSQLNNIGCTSVSRTYFSTPHPPDSNIGLDLVETEEGGYLEHARGGRTPETIQFRGSRWASSCLPTLNKQQ